MVNSMRRCDIPNIIAMNRDGPRSADVDKFADVHDIHTPAQLQSPEHTINLVLTWSKAEYKSENDSEHVTNITGALDS